MVFAQLCVQTEDGRSRIVFARFDVHAEEDEKSQYNVSTTECSRTLLEVTHNVCTTNLQAQEDWKSHIIFVQLGVHAGTVRMIYIMFAQLEKLKKM